MTKLVYMLEEDGDDRYITEHMLKELGFEIDMRYFIRSKDLLSQLDKEVPSIILVDYNTSPENGVEVLRRIKSIPAYVSIPVIILSDNNLARYRKICYEQGACSYIRKPANMKDTREKIGVFFKYWLEVAET